MSDQTDGNTGAPSAAGIMDCLRMLAREAAELDLAQTFFAIEQALAACREEAASSGQLIRRALH